jgi:hypothetical protein
MSLWIVIVHANIYSHDYLARALGAYKSKKHAVNTVVSVIKEYYDDCIKNDDLRRIQDVYFPDDDDPPSWEMCELLIRMQLRNGFCKGPTADYGITMTELNESYSEEDDKETPYTMYIKEYMSDKKKTMRCLNQANTAWKKVTHNADELALYTKKSRT